MDPATPGSAPYTDVSMNVLDPRSIVVISAVLAVVTLVIFISLRRSVGSGIKGLNEWIVAFLAVILVVVLLVLRPILHPLWGVVVANTLIVSVAMLFDLGLKRFYGKPASRMPLLITAVGVFASQAFIAYGGLSYRIRLALVTTALLCAFSYALWNLLRNASGTFGERVVQVSLAVPIAGIALRLLTVGDVSAVSQLFRPSPIQSFYLASLGAGILTAGVGFILMVNERTRAELEKLTRSLEQTTQELRQQNEAKSKFLAYAGHDIRQPLQAIHLLLAGLMESGLQTPQQQTARLMETSVNALTDLLDVLLDISRLEAGAIQPQPRPVDLERLLAQLLQEFRPQASARGLQLRLHLPAQEVTVLSDERLLASVLRNLLGNAIKYTQRGGVLVSVRRAGQGYKLQVWDTGIGIAPEHQEQIFEEYYQVDNPQRDRSKGLGLGLAIVRRISALLDLQASCRSRPGRGTVMGVMLPAAVRESAGIGTARPSSDALDLSGTWVVVVEDAAEVAQALVQWLQARGARVTHCRTADEALAVPGIGTADFYLSDYRLPGRMSGLDFLNAMRERRQDEVQAVLLTGDTSSRFIERVAASGWPVLYKPVHPRELRAMLKLVRASGAQAVCP